MLKDIELHNICLKNNISISVAESCTSGNLASYLSNFSGSSNYFKGGIIAYQDNVKCDLLNIEQGLIAKYSSVSSHVAKSMAISVRNIFSSDFAVATTGYAGPFAEPMSLLGNAYVAIAFDGGVFCKKLKFKGSRIEITNQITEHAFLLLKEKIKKAVMAS